MVVLGRSKEAGPDTGSGLVLEGTAIFFLLLEDDGFFLLEG